MTAATEIVPDQALFEGHFPARPILPGVTLIELAVRAIARERQGPLRLSGVTHARLRQPVVPGDRLWLTTRAGEEGRLRFELQRAEPNGVSERVANGELLVGPDVQTPAPLARVGSQVDPAAPPIDRLLPHRPPMLFVSALGHEREDGLSCAVCVPPAWALVENGNAPALAAVEAAAQTAAAWEAVRRARQPGAAGPRIGYLVALREIVFFATRMPAGERAWASVRLETAAPPLTHYRFEVVLGGALVARGRIATYLAAADVAGALAR